MVLIPKFQAETGLAVKTSEYHFAVLYNSREISNIPEWVYEAKNSISAVSLHRWRQKKKGGINALADNYGNRKGSGIIDSNEEIRQLILGMLTDFPHCSAAHVMAALRARFDRSILPSYRSVQRWLTNWKKENAQLHMAMSNPDKWRGRYQAAGGSYSEGIVRLNQLWEYDSTPSDILLSDGKRHNIVGVIDVYSRRLILHVSRTSTSTAVASITRKALINWGVPEIAKTDNGADYVSKHMCRIFASLDIEQKLCQPFTPEGKPHVERVFRTFSHSLLELLPGFIGHNVAERKDIEARRSFANRLMKQGTDPIELKITPEELQEFCDNWCNNFYSRNAHSGLNGKTPYQMVSEWTEPLKKIPDERALDVLLSEAAGNDGWRTITKKGIRVETVAYDHANLGGLEGENVRVLFD
ncbi:MAG: DDE-type integrase/transposase/recombinase, partial [Alphaproteobacteria bacterium]|nr:DDE-type integrase/transposase/recombinase [Alphaproteobacteria bacterium]